jgi:putative solute:sodium symporter small subunit
MSAAARKWFWSRTRRLTAGLLLLWLLANLGVPWFARDLDRLLLFGVPLAYWRAAAGLLLLYLVIIVIHVLALDRLEARYRASADGEDAGAALR